MSRQKEDSLVKEIRCALMPGQLVRRNEVSQLVNNLDQVHEKLKLQAQTSDAKRAVGLYEIFLAGVYAKINETDDECYLAWLFQSLICSWIQARQAAGMNAGETVQQLLKWMKKDQYGFCNDVETKVIGVLDAEGQQLFIGHFQKITQTEINREASTEEEYKKENEVRLAVLSLKDIHLSQMDVDAYTCLCDRLGYSPRDCENLAKVEVSNKRWSKALVWVEKGLMLKPMRNWYNEDGEELEKLKMEVYRRLGRKEDALAHAWLVYEQAPNVDAFQQVMSIVPKTKQAKTDWQEKAMILADKTDLRNVIDLYVKAKEWNRLAQRIYAAKPVELEAISHYSAEPAAKGLLKVNLFAAARLYQSQGLRIVNAGKSKYYSEALGYFKNAHSLYLKSGQISEWNELSKLMHGEHSRKKGLLASFERISSGGEEKASSFAEEAKRRWDSMTS